MDASFQTNPQLELAFDYVRNTNRNIFLTGKAGTGKTTFLHQIKKDNTKRLVVVAPTGVAAINAGGMTIHSFFQLPFGPYLPGNAQEINRQRKFSREKIRLIQSLDLLVIDEISMVRADLLDGIDDVLRRYKNSYQPFGGAQLLMIGDLHQLSPVAKGEEWDLLREHYQTPYFFSSRALRETRPVTIELKHIYRQSDDTFIRLLNKVRDNKLDAEVLATLNSRFVADFKPSPEEGYITLTSHNAVAQDINAQKLVELPEKLRSFKASVSGDFPAHAFPVDETFDCKKGAQVMFAKNDRSPEKRYYNGKIGQITRFDGEAIYVKCPGDADEIAVLPVEWENVKYSLNETTKEVTENVAGTFTQHPLKLAWAITIHKSQGLTFERAIIDAQAAFAHGQVYVALSRCKSFEGIVLRSKIGHSSVKTDEKVKNYTEEADRNAPDEAHLVESKKAFQQGLIREMFDFRHLKNLLEKLERVFLEHENALLGDGPNQFKTFAVLAETEVFALADKFGAQLQGYFSQPGLPESQEDLQQRLQKAGAWFAEKLNLEVLPALKNIQILTDNQSVRKAALEAMDNLNREIFAKTAGFGVAKNGFSVQAFLHAKANAELDFKAAQAAPPPPAAPIQTDIPKDVQHPILFARLKKWRDEQAEAQDLPLYVIMHTRELLEIVNLQPTSPAALRKIKGIGERKVAKYGAELLAIIQAYRDEKHLPTETISLPPASAPAPKSDTKAVTVELFKSGKSMDEIALERGLTRSTIEGHLAHFIGLGELDILEVMDKEDVRAIECFFEENNTASSGEAKAHFGERYSYGEIKMVLRYMANGRGGQEA